MNKSAGSLWCLYSRARDTFFNGLSFQEARAIARVLLPEERAQWYAWKEGWKDWRKLNTTTELITSSSATVRMVESPPLPAAVQFTVTPSSSMPFEEMPIEKVITPHLERPKREVHVERKTSRIAAVFEVEIICQGRKFHSQSVDVSVSGVQIKDSVPEWMAGYCTMLISRADVSQKLEFVCSVVEDQDPDDRRRLELHPSKDTSHLRRWLSDLTQNSKETA